MKEKLNKKLLCKCGCRQVLKQSPRGRIRKFVNDAHRDKFHNVQKGLCKYNPDIYMLKTLELRNDVMCMEVASRRVYK